jgi:hypothetical protein
MYIPNISRAYRAFLSLAEMASPYPAEASAPPSDSLSHGEDESVTDGSKGNTIAAEETRLPLRKHDCRCELTMSLSFMEHGLLHML